MFNQYEIVEEDQAQCETLDDNQIPDENFNAKDDGKKNCCCD